MNVKVYTVTFSDDTITVEWVSDEEQTHNFADFHQTTVTREGESQWPRVKYYADELRQDAEEFVHWVDKYRRGVAD